MRIDAKVIKKLSLPQMIRRPTPIQSVKRKVNPLQSVKRKVNPHNHRLISYESTAKIPNAVLLQEPLNTQIPQNALVINLPKSIDRLENFMRNNSFNGVTYVISAIDGLTLPKVPEGVPLRQGSLGCLLSHKKALEYALENNYSSVIIFEDDAQLIPTFNDELKRAMLELPQNWDLLWLAGNDDTPSYPYSKNLKRLNGSWGTYAYVINRNVYEYFIELFSEQKKSSDDYYRINHPRFNSFRTVIPLAKHAGFVSDRIETDRIGKQA